MRTVAWQVILPLLMWMNSDVAGYSAAAVADERRASSTMRPPRTKTLTVAAKDREMYAAVRVRAELTQDDQ